MEPIVLNNLFPHNPSLPGGFKPVPLPADTDPGTAPHVPGTSLDKIDLEQDPEKILNQRILESLNKVLTESGNAQIETLDPLDFTPEKVAGNILNSINSFLAAFIEKNPDQEELDGFFSQVREGFERGFNEAKEILQGLGALQGKVAEDIETTYGLVQEGLDRLAEQVSQLPETTPSVIESEQTYSASFSKSQSGSITIETQEGDLVTIDFNKSTSSSISSYLSVANQTVEQGYEHQVQASANLSFTVQGDLNEDEHKAVEKLIRRIDKVADKFFDGKFEQAFRKASNIKFDGEQLSSFSVDLSTEISRSIQATRTETITTPVSVEAPVKQAEVEDDHPHELIPKLENAEDLVKVLDELPEQEEGAQLFEKPKYSIRDLFKDIANYKLENDPVLKSLENSSDDLLKNLVADMREILQSISGFE